MRRMLYMRKEPVSGAAILYLLIAGFVMLPTRWLGDWVFPENAALAEMFGLGGVRLLLCGVTALLAYHMGICRIWLPQGGGRAILWSLPALAVAVNNFPLVALANGTAQITGSPAALAVFALECVGVGLFEEIAFRGILFPFVLGKTGTDQKGRFWAVVLSAALFGALHLINLFNGFSGAVFLQVGYSFLIGSMLAICLFRGAGVFWCAFVHALFNFGGNVISSARGLGSGSFADIWCPAEIVLTALVGLAAAAYFVVLLLRSRPDVADSFAVFPPADSSAGALPGEGAETDKDESENDAGHRSDGEG